MSEETIRRLAPLHGLWTGRGTGDYPTIEPFEYEESLRFEPDSGSPLIHYEQRTVLLLLGHDPRLVRTGRTLAVRGATPWYAVYMATHTTDEPRFARHLRAVLNRSA